MRSFGTTAPVRTTTAGARMSFRSIPPKILADGKNWPGWKVPPASKLVSPPTRPNAREVPLTRKFGVTMPPALSLERVVKSASNGEAPVAESRISALF